MNMKITFTGGKGNLMKVFCFAFVPAVINPDVCKGLRDTVMKQGIIIVAPRPLFSSMVIHVLLFAIILQTISRLDQQKTSSLIQEWYGAE